VLSGEIGTISRTDVENENSRRVFRNAAALLTRQSVTDEAARTLLAQLDYGDDQPDLAPHRSALLRAASRFRRIFAIPAQDAPNLVVLGAEVDPGEVGPGNGPVGHVAGTGLNFRQAFEACAGEGVEYASQFATGDDAIAFLAEDEALAGASAAWHELWEMLGPYRRRGRRDPTAWTSAARLADGEPVRVPADLCFRRPADVRDLDPPWPLSTGTGAGTDPLDAALHGLLELVERDAVALWWRGGRPARIVPDTSGSATLEHLRGGPTRRRSWLLDITSDVGVPVVVAASCNDDGFGLCCGFAARMTYARAADAAVREMAQMELAHHLSETKRQTRGDACLSELDRQHLERFTRIDVRKTQALHPVPPPLGPSHGRSAAGNQQAALGLIRQSLERLGLSPCVLNLTRPEIGVPVVRALCPGLETGMTSPPGPRLRAAAAQSGLDPMRVAPL
jgi:ribosomal protein S12 methylthiotransferase accessory factor